jgi:YbgC/YbaW family acyl-CoA thioester hydrolase
MSYEFGRASSYSNRLAMLNRYNGLMAKFHTQRRIEFGDTDMAGIVHFSNFFRFMESAECEFLRSRGLSVKLEWEGQTIGFPRVSATCDYVAPARFEDLLDVSVTIDRVGTKSVTYAFEFTRNGQRIAAGKVTSVCCRVSNENLIEGIEIPATYRSRLLSVEASVR